MLANELQTSTVYNVTVYGGNGVELEDQLAFASPLFIAEGYWNIEEDVVPDSIKFLVNSYERLPALNQIHRIDVERVTNVY